MQWSFYHLLNSTPVTLEGGDVRTIEATLPLACFSAYRRRFVHSVRDLVKPMPLRMQRTPFLLFTSLVEKAPDYEIKANGDGGPLVTERIDPVLLSRE